MLCTYSDRNDKLWKKRLTFGLLFASYRHKYYDFLQIANDGDTRPFVRFIADCTDKTIDLFLWATSELSHQVPLLSDPEESDDRPALSRYNHIFDDNDIGDFSGDTGSEAS